MTRTPNVGDPPDRRSPEAVIHLRRLANSLETGDRLPLAVGLRELATQMNARLPAGTQIAETDPRCDRPFEGVAADEIEAAAFIAAGAYTMNDEQREKIRTRPAAYLMLERYYIWSRGMRREVDRRAASEPETSEDAPSDVLVTPEYEIGGLVGHWFASLCPVIEGWEQLGLEDAAINKLLEDGRSSGVLSRLFRFRNAIFHFQSDPDDPRIRDFMDKRGQARVWTISLDREFQRFFREQREQSYIGLNAWALS